MIKWNNEDETDEMIPEKCDDLTEGEPAVADCRIYEASNAKR